MIEHEAGLIDYVKVISKRKWLILSTFLIVIALVIAVNLFVPKVYIAKTSIEIGYQQRSIIVFNQDFSPPRDFLEPPSQVTEKITSGSYNAAVMKELNLQRIEELPAIEAINPSNTYLVNITAKYISPDQAKKTLEVINSEILKEHQERAKVYKNYDFLVQTRVVISPTVTQKKPKLTLDVIIAGFLGLFLGILGAFISKWWDQNKSRLKT